MVDLFPNRYEVKFQNGMECGGAYIKLLSQTPDLQLVSRASSRPDQLVLLPLLGNRMCYLNQLIILGRKCPQCGIVV